MVGHHNVAFELSEPSTSYASVYKYESRAVVVAVRNANKFYTKDVPVLSSFNMTVEKGTIYALLGSSGCGKTTMLSCVIGIQQLDSGSILVFGKKPGDPDLDIPGHNVGYMPQDIVLYEDFTVNEMLSYYGALYCMATEEIRGNTRELTKLLDLPNKHRQIKLLSSGQKRRVSMAVSMIHSPRLLILDEPTVGVDPILRESIWKHLLDRVAKFQTTVIITTHYIEEAKNANKIGIMRDGRLLAEDTPHSLLQQHNAPLLEDVVIKLCKQDSRSENREVNVTKSEKCNLDDVTYANMDDFLDATRSYTDSFRRTLALAKKNGKIVWKNKLFLVFFLFVPVMTNLSTPYVIGSTIGPMNLAIVNEELSATNFTTCEQLLRTYSNCTHVGASCQYISHLPKEIIKSKHFTNETLARRSVKKGKNWGYMQIPENFSKDYRSRLVNRSDQLENSNPVVHLDESQRMISDTLKLALSQSFQTFSESYLVSCGYSKRLVEPDLIEEEPVYANSDLDQHKTFFIPASMTVLLFYFPCVATGVQYIIEKRSGANERAFVAGAQQKEIFGAFLLSTSVIVLIQAGLQLLVAMTIHDVEIKGSLPLFVILCLNVGLAGISLGYLFGHVCRSPEEVVILSLAVLWPSNTMTGLLSPAEAMPKGFWYASYLFVPRPALDSMRSIMNRGWGLDHEKVWPGFFSPLGWALVYWLLSVASAKLKSIL